jgi:glycerol-3-phosphate dehydrogenase
LGHGAVLANYVEAAAPIRDGQRAAGVRAKDHQSGREIEIGAQVTVNATGASLDRLLKPLGVSAGWPLLKAMNLVTNRDAGDEALGGISAAGRRFFLVPWQRRALFGTWESSQPAAAEDTSASTQEMERFISELNHAFPSLELTTADVTLVHRGVVPAVAGPNGSVALAGHEQVRDHARESGTAFDGLLSVAGTKYTTARAVAERVTNTIVAKLRRSVDDCRTASTPLPGGDLGDIASAVGKARHEYDARLPSDTIPHLLAAYGSRYREVVETAHDRPEWRSRLAETSPVIGAQIAWAARKEMALTLSDAVLRRTPLGALGYPGDRSAEQAAAIMAGELGWSAKRTREELEKLKRFYVVN